MEGFVEHTGIYILGMLNSQRCFAQSRHYITVTHLLLLTPWTGVLLRSWWLLSYILSLLRSKGSSPCSQQFATGPYPIMLVFIVIMSIIAQFWTQKSDKFLRPIIIFPIIFHSLIQRYEFCFASSSAVNSLNCSMISEWGCENNAAYFKIHSLDGLRQTTKFLTHDCRHPGRY